MGKNKVIDREAALRAAERLVERAGSAELTHGNLSAEAGISKGGVQSCFGTKNGLLDALLSRWIDDLGRRTVSGSDGRDVLESFILSRLYPDETTIDRVPSLLAALSRATTSLAPLRDWHGNHAPAAEGSGNTRLAYFAAQGLFLLQALGLMEVEATTADAVREDILSLLDAD